MVRRAGAACGATGETIAGTKEADRVRAGDTEGDTATAVDGGIATTAGGDRVGAHRHAGGAAGAGGVDERAGTGAVDAPGAGGPGVSALALRLGRHEQHAEATAVGASAS